MAICGSCVVAGEAASPDATAKFRRSKIHWVSAETDEAAARWNRLKSRYDDYRPDVPPVRSRRPPAPIRPIPDDAPAELNDDADWLGEETTQQTASATAAAPAPRPDEPLPISDADEEPAWIYGTTAESVDADELALQDENLPAPQPVPDQPEAPAARPLIAPRADADDPGYAAPTGSRRPRAIHDISPTYDRTSDQDIRDFAKEQLRQYKIEIGGGVFPQRMFPGLIYQWEPSNLYSYPLYFEDPALERYGHTYGDCLQPIASIVRFGVQTVGLPYQMAIDPICCPKYALGWYRPGECAPKLHYQIPLNAKAAAVEAGVITGLFFAIP